MDLDRALSVILPLAPGNSLCGLHSCLDRIGSFPSHMDISQLKQIYVLFCLVFTDKSLFSGVVYFVCEPVLFIIIFAYCFLFPICLVSNQVISWKKLFFPYVQFVVTRLPGISSTIQKLAKVFFVFVYFLRILVVSANPVVE